MNYPYIPLHKVVDVVEKPWFDWTKTEMKG